jgi:hypothetical protein
MSELKRKIIQISSFTMNGSSYIIALCDDGTVWKYGFIIKYWEPIDAIPQV